MSNRPPFRFAVDRGGTFTDIYAEVPGEPGYRLLKLLSEDPDHYPDAPREGIRRILEEETGQPVPAEAIDAGMIDWIRMGTTVATNALLERKGARTALLITGGFGDLLEIGDQSRPQLFNLAIRRPSPLYEEVLEIDERVRLLRADATPPAGHVCTGLSGEQLEIIKSPDLSVIKTELERLLAKGIEAVAIALLHSYTFPDHEQQLGKLAAKVGFRQVSLSSSLMPTIKLVGRGDTTVADAYLSPHIRDYIDNFRAGFRNRLNGVHLQFMRSDGSLTPADNFTGSQAILSGPAGGVVGCARTAFKETGQAVIGFDMGGTSTDVSRYDGDFHLIQENEIAATRIRAPQLDIITVAAGGGSRLFFRHGLFEVGPESAGAHPGPICYRKGGYLTITDANLLLGRLQPEFFPAIFGPHGDQPLDRQGSRTAFEELRREINLQQRQQKLRELSLEEVALGFIRVANEAMARPMREISVSRGYDLDDHVLACFGGAGPQHACALARQLGIKKIHLHRFSGILSAYGLRLAETAEESREPAAEILTSSSSAQLAPRLAVLARKVRQQLRAQGSDGKNIYLTSYLNLRYQGTDTALMIAEPEDGDYLTAFLQRHRQEFGFTLENRAIVVDDLRVRGVAVPEEIPEPVIAVQAGEPRPERLVDCYFMGGWRQTPIYRWEKLGGDALLTGPALVIQDTGTILVEPGCSARVTPIGNLIVTVNEQYQPDQSAGPDPIRMAIFGNLFMSIAEQMGQALQRTAISTNIKERCDFSCALFDSRGGLVANAPHQPVHLGAMSEAVRRQIERRGRNWRDGEVILSNHPALGGSHLPDLTVITPVFVDDNPLFFLANRGHHADIGGITPGSMPPFSRTLAEEGVCLESFLLVENNIFREDAVRELLEQPQPLPDGTLAPGARAVADNISDLKAQVAANRKGLELLGELLDHYSAATVAAYMAHIQTNAEQAIRTLLKDMAAKRGRNRLQAEDYMDDGSPIRLQIEIDPESGAATFDFAGTGPQVSGNWNTPRSVTSSAVIYVLRCLIDQEIPLNQGCLNPITIRIPAGSLLDPDGKAAVVGGNVLTSQRLVDVILKAFEAAAASQGCMNNLTFGNETFGYYETIGGGAGAGPGWQGQSGVHTHMTNTRITDPEILERRYPVLLRQFSLRPGSGGDGLNRGGDGIIREIEFLAELSAAILSERRLYAPYGLAGGKDGARGENLLLRKNGEVINLGGKNQLAVDPGDRLRISTPGGGWGS